MKDTRRIGGGRSVLFFFFLFFGVPGIPKAFVGAAVFFAGGGRLKREMGCTVQTEDVLWWVRAVVGFTGVGIYCTSVGIGSADGGCCGRSAEGR